MIGLLATACSGLFAGAAVYISVVQHPAALQVDDTVAARLFSPMYRRGAPLQAGLALVGSLAAFTAWLTGSGLQWLVGALLLGFVIPFTLIVIKPVNDRLLASDLDPTAPEVTELLRCWGKLHNVRSGSSTLAFLLFLIG